MADEKLSKLLDAPLSTSREGKEGPPKRPVEAPEDRPPKRRESNSRRPRHGPPPQQQRYDRGPPRRRPDRRPPPSEDDETKFKYKWTHTADNVRILSVIAFGTELISVSSNGNLRLDSGGFRTFRVFQAFNMCLQPLSLKVIADGDGDAPGYKGGSWKLKHTHFGWVQDFVDGMKLSAFPNRDWKRILPKLEALPQSVVFSYETEH